MNYTVIDIETTGLSKHKHKITEIAAVEVKNNKIKRRFESLINPECHIPSFITKLTGINDDMVADAPTVEKVMPKFVKFLGEKTMVAHNATFDYGFLSVNALTHLEHEMMNERLCTRKLATRLLPDLPRKRLANLCEHFNIDNQQAHRAMGDTMATHEAFLNMRSILHEKGFKTEEEVLKFERYPVAKAQRFL